MQKTVITKNKMIRNCISLFLVFISSLSFSQINPDFASLNYSLIGKSDFKGRVGAVKLNNFDFNFVTPTIKLGSKTSINNIIYYRFLDYTISTQNSNVENLPTNINEIKYTAFIRHSLNSKWDLYIIPRLSVRSDLNSNINSKDMFPAFSTIAMKASTKIKNFKWGFGVNYNNDLDKNSIIPILAFTFSNEKMRLNAFLPNNASLVFTTNKKMEYGIGINSDPIIFHVNSADSIDYIRTLNVNVNPIFSYNLGSNIWLNLKTGLTFNREFNFLDSNFESNLPGFENKLRTSYFAQIGFSMRSKK